MHFLDALNPEQKEAALHKDGPLLIFAGAGSGKTRVLTYRVARLIESGVIPRHILAITFTNKAAREMRERIEIILTATGLYGAQDLWVSTFHALCVRLLRRELPALGHSGSFTILDASDSERLIKQCVAACDLDDKAYPARAVAAAVSGQKNELIDPQDAAQNAAGDFRMSNIARVYAEYQRRLAQNNAFDFDDLIFRMVRILSEVPEVRLKYQDRFRYVCVDEYQDTNTAQYRLVTLLAGYANNLVAVGDDDQSIYGWRGANIRNILRFEKDFPGARVVKLEQNYRCTQTILDAANAVIARNEERADKRLWTDNAQGERLRLYEARDESDEAAFVVAAIKKSGGRLSDYAVLYRNNAQSRAVEDALVMAGVPYRLYGGVRFYERMEVKDALAYLRVLANPADDLSCIRALGAPRRGIGEARVARVAAYAAEAGLSFSDACRQAGRIPDLRGAGETLKAFAAQMDAWAALAAEAGVADVLETVLRDTGYLESLRDGTVEGEGRVENVKELLSKAAAFGQRDGDTGLAAFLEDVALVADTDTYDENAEYVSLMTLHSAKGLEFDTVFIVGAEENIFPAARSANSGDPSQLEEERRLCYVGFTRAKRLLYMCHAVRRMQYGNPVANPVSRFVLEVPERCVEHVRPGRPAHPNAGVAAPRHGGAATLLSGSQSPSRGQFANPYLAPKPGPGVYKKPEAAKSGGTAYRVGDRVRQAAYGVGRIIAVREKGGDQELSVAFDGAGVKKFLAGMAKLTKE